MNRFTRGFIFSGTLVVALLPGCSHKTNVSPSGPQPVPATATPTPTPSATPSSSPTASATATPTVSATPTATPQVTATPTVTGGAPIATITATLTPTALQTQTAATSPTRTPTLASTNTRVPTQTFTLTHTFTPTVTGTLPTVTSTPTWTNTWTITPIPTLVTCSNTTTLGDTSINADVGFTQGDIFLSRYNLFWDSNVTAIKGWFEIPGSATGQVEFVVYDETAGQPDRLVYASNPINFPSGSAFSPVTLACSPNISFPAGNYWVGFWGATSGTGFSAQHQGTGLGTVAYFLNQAVLPAVMPPLAGNGIEYGGNLTLTWDACHQPVITPTPTDLPTLTPTPTFTFTPTGTLTPPLPTPTPTPT